MRLSRFAGNIIYPFPQAEIANPLPISPCFRGQAVLASIGKPARAYNVLTYASGLGDLSTKHKRKWARRFERGLNRRRQCRFHTRASPLRRLAKPMRLSRFAGNIVYPFPQSEIANPLPISPCFRVQATLRRVFERVCRWERTLVRDQWQTLSKRSISGMSSPKWARRLERGLNCRRQYRFHTRASPLRRLAKPMRLSRFAGNIVYPFPQAEMANPLPISPCFRVKAWFRRV